MPPRFVKRRFDLVTRLSLVPDARHCVIRLHRWVASLSTVATLASACASNRVPVYVAPSTATIESGTEMTLGGDGQVVFVYNHSSVPIKVTGLHLLECENIKNRCDLQLLRVPVPAGQRVILTTVRPDNTSRPWSFRFTFSWEPARD